MLDQNYKLKRKRARPRKKLKDKLSKVLTTDKQKSFLRNRIAGITSARQPYRQAMPHPQRV